MIQSFVPYLLLIFISYFDIYTYESYKKNTEELEMTDLRYRGLLHEQETVLAEYVSKLNSYQQKLNRSSLSLQEIKDTNSEMRSYTFKISEYERELVSEKSKFTISGLLQLFLGVFMVFAMISH